MALAGESLFCLRQSCDSWDAGVSPWIKYSTATSWVASAPAMPRLAANLTHGRNALVARPAPFYAGAGRNVLVRSDWRPKL